MQEDQTLQRQVETARWKVRFHRGIVIVLFASVAAMGMVYAFQGVGVGIFYLFSWLSVAALVAPYARWKGRLDILETMQRASFHDVASEDERASTSSEEHT